MPRPSQRRRYAAARAAQHVPQTPDGRRECFSFRIAVNEGAKVADLDIEQMVQALRDFHTSILWSAVDGVVVWRDPIAYQTPAQVAP